MEAFLKHAASLKPQIATLSPQKKSEILHVMAQALRDSMDSIIKANEIDMQYAKKISLSLALQDRLYLDSTRIEDMAASIETIANLKEPIGRILEGWVTPEGLRIEKVSVPIGVIGVIYESRPNVTADTAALCFKSGNICILKGGKEAHHSNHAIANILQQALEKSGLNANIISLLPDDTREGVANLIKQDKYVDLIVPRGGENLIRFVSQNATVPVVKHDKGLCHIFVDESADETNAIDIIENAKCQRPGVCNAVETVLIHANIANSFLPKLYGRLIEQDCTLYGCEATQKIVNVNKANEENFHTEYLAKTLNIKIVTNTQEAIAHIQTYGSGHSESILTQNYTNGECFLNSVDAACVYVNASTRFTDGGAFGFGAEVGISTNKLHARGPMGINELTTYKFKIYGQGQIRG
jgi:glutamate-5-semialdehyde dehydrogenase